MIKNQVITDQYAIYESDCMYVIPTLPDKSIDFSIYSPPFAGLYNYSSSDNDFSNCETKEQFLEQYEFLIMEIARVTKPGRITAVHVTNIKDSKTGDMWDFPHEVVDLHQKHGFSWKDKITIWKEPLKVRMRTMVRSLMHKLIVEDSSECFTAMPDYLLVFKRAGEVEVPVTHERGLSEYAGEYPFLIPHLDSYGLIEDIKPYYNDKNNSYEMTTAVESYIQKSFNALRKKYEGWEDPKTNKLSHIIWQRYASSVWDDIRIDHVLPFRDSKDEDDEKHVHPLQLDVIHRGIELWSNPGEVVLTPFLGVGSEAYEAVRMKRKAIGIELKDTYFKQACINMESLKNQVIDNSQLSLI
jgi:DNA modification methylase